MLQMNLPFYPDLREPEEETIIWTKELSRGLFDVFRSRLSKELRNPVIRLAAVLTDSFSGFGWISREWDPESVKLFKLLSRLVCIEISLGFSTQVESSEPMGCCFTLLEHIILTLVKEEEGKLVSSLSSDEMYSLLTAIRETMASVIDYLTEATVSDDMLLDENNAGHQIIWGAIRVFCVWVTEETEALREEIRRCLPFMLRVFDAQRKRTSSSSRDFEHMMVTAFHSLCIEDKETRDVLLKNELMASVRQSINSCPNCSQPGDVCKSLDKILTL
jgi:hypothetical protein